jgi:hypothetical protein
MNIKGVGDRLSHRISLQCLLPPYVLTLFTFQWKLKSGWYGGMVWCPSPSLKHAATLLERWRCYVVEDDMAAHGHIHVIQER